MKRLVILLILPIFLIAQLDDYKTNYPDRKMYVSGLIQYGPGSEKVLAGENNNLYYNYLDYEIYIRPGGGFGPEAIFGLSIVPSISAEIGYGFSISGRTFNVEQITFSKTYLRASLIYKLRMFDFYTAYFGGGYSVIQNAVFKIEQSEETFKAYYTKPKGYHIIGGLQFNYTKDLYFFGDIKYYNYGNFEINDVSYTYSSINIVDVDSKFHEFDANSLQLTFGIGYYIK